MIFFMSRSAQLPLLRLMCRAGICLSLLFVIQTAHASYARSCELHGQVLSVPDVRAAFGLDMRSVSFRFKVLRAKRGSGRSDGSCKDFLGSQDITINLPAHRAPPRRNQRITIEYTHFSDESSPGRSTYQWPAR
jgi:hypothetical protein